MVWQRRHIPMTDNNQSWWNKPAPVRQPKPGELLFEFVRASDRAPMSCELRFYPGTYDSWEVQILERGELFAARGAFTTKAAAIAWAEHERKALGLG
jgi:hypothetical protein